MRGGVEVGGKVGLIVGVGVGIFRLEKKGQELVSDEGVGVG